MTDVLICGVPDDVATALDVQARRLGLFRTEYLRRHMARIAATGHDAVTPDTLLEFTATFADRAEPDVMARAWE